MILLLTPLDFKIYLCKNKIALLICIKVHMVDILQSGGTINYVL